VRFFLDHDVPDEVARVLETEGHELTLLRHVLPITAGDPDALAYGAKHHLFVITCNRDDFLKLALQQENPGVIILIRRQTRHLECAHLLTLLHRAGESGIRNNINFA
jgi:predicted nuclease of predicted toxin-antitoxin system